MEAVIREVKEEVGLDVELAGAIPQVPGTGSRELLPPRFLNRHFTDPGHEHIAFIYFARAKTDHTVETEAERSRGLHWFTAEELDDPSYEILPRIRHYAKAALKELGDNH